MLAILFDVDDTLYDQMIPFKTAFEECFENQYEISCESLYPIYRKHSDHVFDASQKGEITMEEMYIHRLQKAMGECGIDISAKQGLDFQEIYAKNQKEIYISKRMQDILTLCQKHNIKMGIISNGPSEHQWKKVEKLQADQWIPRKHVFISADLGVTKPNIRVFECVSERMDLTKDTVYFVGDSYSNDIIGAKKAGWGAIWMDRRGYLPDEQEVQPDYCVKNENELEIIIQELLKNHSSL